MKNSSNKADALFQKLSYVMTYGSNPNRLIYQDTEHSSPTSGKFFNQPKSLKGTAETATQRVTSRIFSDTGGPELRTNN